MRLTPSKKVASHLDKSNKSVANYFLIKFYVFQISKSMAIFIKNIQDVPFFEPGSLTMLWILLRSKHCDWSVIGHKQWLVFKKTEQNILIGWGIHSLVRE